MAKGIIYVMSTVVPGLIKIGKTGSESFENRMYSLEHNGYSNVVGLQRQFAIEVEEYDEKETLLDDIFSKSRVPETELFALDINIVIQLLSSFEGKQVYPETETKEQSFDEATAKRHVKEDWGLVPDGTYYLKRKIKRNGNKAVEASMIVKEGRYIIPKGTVISPTEAERLADNIRSIRHSNAVKDYVTQEDVTFMAPSAASDFVTGGPSNGWVNWKNKDGDLIDIYRNK